MNKKICVILCTRNGEEYLAHQVESILSCQNNIDIYVNDDCSTDKTYSILTKYSSKLKKVTQKRYSSPAKNFIGTLQSVEENYDYYAFSDQDDLWHEEKVNKGLFSLDNLSAML